MPYEKKPDEIGALWREHNDKGEYLSGEVNGEKVICFPVKSDSVKAPAYRVLKRRPKGEAGLSPTRAPHDANAAQLTDKDIPF